MRSRKKSIRTQIEFPEPANDLVMPSVAETTPIEAIPVNFSDLLKENKEVVTDEEDPWFGFME